MVGNLKRSARIAAIRSDDLNRDMAFPAKIVVTNMDIRPAVRSTRTGRSPLGTVNYKGVRDTECQEEPSMPEQRAQRLQGSLRVRGQP